MRPDRRSGAAADVERRRERLLASSRAAVLHSVPEVEGDLAKLCKRSIAPLLECPRLLVQALRPLAILLFQLPRSLLGRSPYRLGFELRGPEEVPGFLLR